jgi:fumarate reductase flavoprotein subunit
MGAIREAQTLADLAAVTGLPEDALRQSLASVAPGRTDAFGRAYPGPPLAPPYCAVKVTGALFHTQGGLDIDADARVLSRDGSPFPNLFAAGGAAVGVSGTGDSGYLSGNGLLSAIVLGHVAGRQAAIGTSKEKSHA